MDPVVKSVPIRIGMPHMIPDQLSEVELIKLAGDMQWGQIGEALDCPSHELANDAGDRLYASFINVEASFRPGDIGQFHEGDLLHLSGAVRFYAKQFVEGFVVVSRDEKPDDATLRGIGTREDLDRMGLPWIYMTNALVARLAGNQRLKTFRPAGIQNKDVPETAGKPHGLSRHEEVLVTNRVDLPGQPGHEGGRPLTLTDEAPVVYEITPENDLNGAGLLYFARYVAMMNYAERITLLRRLPRPFSSHLTQFLACEHRSTYYFANAAPTDRVHVYCSMSLAGDPESIEQPDVTATIFTRLVLDFELYRESDGVLMARSRAVKRLTIPNRIKTLQAEARRFLETHAG